MEIRPTDPSRPQYQSNKKNRLPILPKLAQRTATTAHEMKIWTQLDNKTLEKRATDKIPSKETAQKASKCIAENFKRTEKQLPGLKHVT
jgi:hypothetical protein